MGAPEAVHVQLRRIKTQTERNFPGLLRIRAAAVRDKTFQDTYDDILKIPFKSNVNVRVYPKCVLRIRLLIKIRILYLVRTRDACLASACYVDDFRTTSPNVNLIRHCIVNGIIRAHPFLFCLLCSPNDCLAFDLRYQNTPYSVHFQILIWTRPPLFDIEYR